MIFAGISRKVTDILTDVGESFFQQNGRMLVDQELQRRHGFAASSLPQASGKIIGIACAYTPNGPVVITQTAGILIGTRNPLAKWSG